MLSMYKFPSVEAYWLCLGVAVAFILLGAWVLTFSPLGAIVIIIAAATIVIPTYSEYKDWKRLTNCKT